MSALTEVILFVGGPADGQRIAIDAGKDSWNVATPRDNMYTYDEREPSGMKETIIPEPTRYRRQQTPGGHVMIAVGLGVNELIRLLIQHYTPGIARIEGRPAFFRQERVVGVEIKAEEAAEGGRTINEAFSHGSNRAVVVFQARR